ncbi:MULTISPECIES: hypothetical protein [unclassified Streptomyces]|uniref:hypothetical protein n=1 Tax=unclassified Streptomyces TaxID=2593676 RepID=UPI0033A43B57
MSDDLNLPVPQAEDLLRSLMEVLYLSPGCAAGHHVQCESINPFTSLVCCCTECGHVDPRARGLTSAGTPLLHLGCTEDEYLDTHVYADGEALGVRSDLVRALDKTLAEALTPHTMSDDERQRIAVQLGIACCLTFAPRSL